MNRIYTFLNSNWLYLVIRGLALRAYPRPAQDCCSTYTISSEPFNNSNNPNNLHEYIHPARRQSKQQRAKLRDVPIRFPPIVMYYSPCPQTPPPSPQLAASGLACLKCPSIACLPTSGLSVNRRQRSSYE